MHISDQTVAIIASLLADSDEWPVVDLRQEFVSVAANQNPPIPSHLAQVAFDAYLNLAVDIRIRSGFDRVAFVESIVKREIITKDL